MATHTAQPGDRFLFCTDGLTDLVADHEIEAILQANHHLKISCRRLINKAKDHGGHDNITVLLVDCLDDKPLSPSPNTSSAKDEQP